MEIVLTSHIYRNSEDPDATDWYNKVTQVIAVTGRNLGERFLVWLPVAPDNVPDPDVDLVDWMPVESNAIGKVGQDTIPAIHKDVDGVGFLRPRSKSDKSLMSGTLSSITEPNSPQGGPKESVQIPGVQSSDPLKRTGISQDTISGNILLKGPGASEIEITKNGIHFNQPVQNIEQNRKGFLKENWLADLLPNCLPVFPASMDKLPDLNAIAGIAGTVMSVMESAQKALKILNAIKDT